MRRRGRSRRGQGCSWQNLSPWTRTRARVGIRTSNQQVRRIQSAFDSAAYGTRRSSDKLVQCNQDLCDSCRPESERGIESVLDKVEETEMDEEGRGTMRAQRDTVRS